MHGIPNGLREVQEEVARGQQPRRRVRELLSWFGAQRRGVWIRAQIEDALQQAGLVTDPDFRTVWIDAEVAFVAAPKPTGDQVERSRSPSAYEGSEYVVRMLDSANRGVVSVKPTDPIEKAVTLMMLHDYSQLAVLTSERELKGAISWKSIGMNLSQKKELRSVNDALVKAEEIEDDASIFDLVAKVVAHDFVFVRGKDRIVRGIVTASDVSRQFHALAKPFLVLGRIESNLRRIIDATFDLETIRSAVHDADPQRKQNVKTAADLTFGEYKRLLENDANWSKLKFFACRETFCKALDEVRDRRNDIMHFHPDALQQSDYEPLEKFNQLLETIVSLSPTSAPRSG
jgi:CBS domain-containing protein